jgi:BlaI family penicillinase repressor
MSLFSGRFYNNRRKLSDSSGSLPFTIHSEFTVSVCYWADCGNPGPGYEAVLSMKKDLNAVILTHQETKVMNAVWRLGGGTVQSVYNAQPRENFISYPSVMKLLRTLETKGLLTHSKTGRAYFYIPILSFRQASENHLRELIDLYFDGDYKKMIEWIFVNMLLDQDPASIEDSVLTPYPAVCDTHIIRDANPRDLPALYAVK